MTIESIIVSAVIIAIFGGFLSTLFWVDDIGKIAADKGFDAGDVFAQEVAKLFLAWGWDVKLNQRRHDYGVDVFASGKDGSAVVQCKHGADGPMDGEVRDLAGVALAALRQESSSANTSTQLPSGSATVA